MESPRSALPDVVTTEVLTLAELLEPFGSGTLLDAVAVAVTGFVLLGVTTTAIETVAPATIVPSVQATCPGDGVHVP